MLGKSRSDQGASGLYPWSAGCSALPVTHSDPGCLHLVDGFGHRSAQQFDVLASASRSRTTVDPTVSQRGQVLPTPDRRPWFVHGVWPSGSYLPLCSLSSRGAGSASTLWVKPSSLSPGSGILRSSADPSINLRMA